MDSTELPGTTTMTFCLGPRNKVKSFSRMLTVLQATTPPFLGLSETRIFKLCLIRGYRPFRRACILLPSGVPRKIGDLSGCLAEKFQKLFSARFDGLGNRLKAGLFNRCNFPQGLAVCVQPKPALLGGGQVREGFPDTGSLFCRIILHGIFVASTVLLALVVDSIVGVAMVAMTLVLCVLCLAAVDDDSTDFVRNLDLRHCSVQECVFDFHNVSFPLEAAPSGRDTKRADGYDGHTGRQHLQEGMTKHGGYIEFKNPCWGFRFSMYPAASNAHLKALR
nr:MAG TPA: hypothetical protein [Caudoviricetes sp.]